MGGPSSSEMVRSIGKLGSTERGSERAPAPLTVCEKKLDIIGCLIPALPLSLVVFDSGCCIAVSNDLQENCQRSRRTLKKETDASSTVTTPRDAGNWSCHGTRYARCPSFNSHGNENPRPHALAASYSDTYRTENCLWLPWISIDRFTS